MIKDEHLSSDDSLEDKSVKIITTGWAYHISSNTVCVSVSLSGC